jgi:nicotinamide riboside kinase
MMKNNTMFSLTPEKLAEAIEKAKSSEEYQRAYERAILRGDSPPVDYNTWAENRFKSSLQVNIY